MLLRLVDDKLVVYYAVHSHFSCLYFLQLYEHNVSLLYLSAQKVHYGHVNLVIISFYHSYSSKSFFDSDILCESFKFAVVAYLVGKNLFIRDSYQFLFAITLNQVDINDLNDAFIGYIEATVTHRHEFDYRHQLDQTKIRT